MKILFILGLSLFSFADSTPLWKKVEIGRHTIEVPIRADGSDDITRMQRRLDQRNTPKTLTPNNNPLWSVTRSWDAKAEVEFRDWIERNLKMEFFRGSQVEVDCADAAIALRWIFSREYGLPAAQTLAGSGRLFGSFGSTDEWDLLPSDSDWRKDERFKAALRYLLDHIYTHSIFLDLYPVEITPAQITTGTVYLTLFGNSGHTRTLMKVNPPYLEFIWGNEPAAEQLYSSQEVPYWVDSTGGGFMKFRWPENVNGVWALRAADQMPGYSTEQYDWGENDYATKFAERIALWDSLHSQIQSAVKQVVQDLEGRLPVVERGFYICSLIPCAPGSAEDQKYSTPQRDHRMAEHAHTAERLIAKLDPTDWLLKDMQMRYSTPILWGASLSWLDLFSRSAVQKLASDPTLSLHARWGLPYATDADGVRVRLNAFINNFQWRLQLVRDAQDLCYPNGSVTPVCDPADKKVIAVDTTRLDQAFKIEIVNLLNLIAQIPADDASVVQAALEQNLPDFNACAGQCNFWQILNGPFVGKMTSSPLDPKDARLGL